jgi:hypothetical protein
MSAHARIDAMKQWLITLINRCKLAPDGWMNVSGPDNNNLNMFVHSLIIAGATATTFHQRQQQRIIDQSQT